MASTFHQKQQVTNSSPGISLSQKKNKMSKASPRPHKSRSFIHWVRHKPKVRGEGEILHCDIPMGKMWHILVTFNSKIKSNPDPLNHPPSYSVEHGP